jgi:hypothetical protein
MRGPLAGTLAGRLEFGPGTLGERVHPEIGQELVGDFQLLACINTSPFPGGSRERGDAGPVETALREATEETGLDPAGVEPLALLPRLHIPPSRFDVTGVLAHRRNPSAVTAIDRAETARVMRIPVSTLADPANRLILSTDFGWRGPAFLIPGAVVWGYTGETLAAVLRLGGWERPWTPTAPVGLNQAWQLAS